MTRGYNGPAQSIDIFIGNRIRESRIRQNWTLFEMSEKLNISHQQLQKYEQGVTRVTAAFLFEIATLLSISLNSFYEGYDTNNNYDKISTVRTQPLNLLLVEDDPTDELFIRETIVQSRQPTNIFSMHDGEQLLSFLRNRTGTNRFPRPDLIFLDLTLARKAGLHVLKEIKRDRHIQDIPVITLSHTTERKVMMDCYQNQASGFIRKAFGSPEFEEQITKTIDYWSRICLPNM